MPCKAIKVEILHPGAIFVNGLAENLKTVKADENQTIKLFPNATVFLASPISLVSNCLNFPLFLDVKA